MITIVDYGVGNVASLVNMLEHVGYESTASSSPQEVAAASRIILPGIGAFDHAMRTLAERDLIAPLRHAALVARVPVLGVCLGMQLLANSSEEGVLPGLGFIDADVVRLPQTTLKVPNVGWHTVTPIGATVLFPDTDVRERFYFVHSYRIRCRRREDVAATIDYGATVEVAVRHDNICGVQFHPEKSHRFGMRLLRSFAEA